MRVLKPAIPKIKINKEALLKHNSPSWARWLTFWPTIKSTDNSTQINLPVAPIMLGFIVSLGLIGWFFWQNKGVSPLTAQVNESELGYIGRFIDLPQETPQVAIVSDASLLNQSFFDQAENGDYVIVYKQSGKVLLYRPATKKVINFANINIPVSETKTLQVPN